MKTIKTWSLITFVFIVMGCEEFLDEPIYSQLASENLLNSEEGIRNVLYSAYAEFANMNGANSKAEIASQEWPTDLMWQTGGGENGNAVQYINYTLDPGLGLLYSVNWAPYYRAIRNANIILDNIEKIESPKKEQFEAEAKFIRAVSYYRLYLVFGPVPIRESESDELSIPRPSEEEMERFIESELIDVVDILPKPGNEEEYGRAHIGAAYGFLCKFYLNTKQWQKCINVARNLIELEYFELEDDYVEMFKIENEQNKEFIWVKPAYPSADRATSNDWMNGAFPVDFFKDPASGLEFQDNWVIFASEYRMRDDFYNSFASNDLRKKLIITSFINGKGDTISLLGEDNTRSFKYWPDPKAVAQSHGNDIPVIRFADILLSQAEALAELEWPNMEAIDLVNRVRERAGVDFIRVEDFPEIEDFREHLLKERGWEFYSEGKRRNDMIRMGVLIKNANERGISNAEEFRILFPIPQQAIDSDPILIQNPGY